MKHFAHYDSEGQIIGFYADDTHKVIPEPHVEITLDDLSKHASNEQILCVDLAGGKPSLKEYMPPPPSLEEQKTAALQTASATASAYRRQIAKQAHEDRAIAWALKTPLALLWQMHEGTTDPAIVPLVAEAQAGFEDEAEALGETPEELRAACIGKWVAFFRATQIVEGMERLAERRIPAAQSPEELQTVIAELQAKETVATAKLATLNEGGEHA
ncbi:hypothetical protein [Aliiroseovarius lamellibrachiae]|uniref:hypothetical protein n=1 Tax=Aliiroseovarius lamellibrachiae TaxID=1924933 RepID=UPI001BE049E7|nr:hypothetical protein [Aliiroseovarius lamellibrachiae]MBT2131230.1 hypothetical protein [Aliiroseovarius lamellibrachiae]